MKTFPFPSSSEPGVVHTTTLHDSGAITCTCKGATNGKICWHIRSVGGNPVKPMAPVRLPFDDEPAPAEPSLGFIQPMNASALDEDKTITDYQTDGWLLEEKYDGHRMIVKVHQNGTATAWSRAGNERTLPPHITARFKHMPPCTPDGELYIPGGTSTDVTMLTRQHELKLVLFDILQVGSQSVMAEPSDKRRDMLEVALSKLNATDDSVSIAPQFPVTEAGLQAIYDRGGEGAIIKKVGSLYAPGKRAKYWIKFKKEQAAVVTVTSFKEGEFGPHSVLVCVDDHGIPVSVKSRNDHWRAVFLTQWQKFIGVRLVIAYQEKTKTKRYRSPRADHFLEDTVG